MASRRNVAERVHAVRNPELIRRVSSPKDNGISNASVRPAKAIPDDACRQLGATLPPGAPKEKLSQAASDKNQVMDELLNQDQIPADYGTQMVALFRDPGQDLLTRDFAVQHIGLYAQALRRRGIYDPASISAASGASFPPAQRSRRLPMRSPRQPRCASPPVPPCACFRPRVTRIYYNIRHAKRLPDAISTPCAMPPPMWRHAAISHYASRTARGADPAGMRYASQPLHEPRTRTCFCP